MSTQGVIFIVVHVLIVRYSLIFVIIYSRYKPLFC